MTFSSLVGRPACHFECVYTTLELNHAAEALKTVAITMLAPGEFSVWENLS